MSEDQPWTHDALWRAAPPLHLDPLPPRRQDGGPAWPDPPTRGGDAPVADDPRLAALLSHRPGGRSQG